MSHLIPSRAALAAAGEIPPVAEATQQGQLLTVRVNLPRYSEINPGKRAKIVGFTRPARLRMLKSIARIDWENAGKCVLITLTYPDAYLGRTYAERTRDRTLFTRKIEKLLGKKVATLWRLEYQPRKSGENIGRIAYHFHLIVFGVPFIHKLGVRLSWRQVLAHTGPLATDIRATNDGRHASRYAAKYAAKAEPVSALDYDSYLDRMGRAWGLTRKNLIPFAAERCTPVLTKDQIARAMQLAGEQLEREYTGSFFLFSAAAAVHYAMILGIPVETLAANDPTF